MQRTAIINVVGLTRSHIGSAMPNIQAFVEKNDFSVVEPVFPAVTTSAQSTYLTGSSPSEHGIVGNGWYDRKYGEHFFWKQSNHLVYGKKIWENLKEEDPDFTCAKLFWWYNMFSSADYSVTPRPLYLSDGRKVFDVHSEPMEMREELKAELGDFPFPQFWGPLAGIESSQWIAQSAKWVEEKHWPTLSLVYLPHLDYNLQRFGPNHSEIKKDLREIDVVVGDLINFYERRSIKPILLSEYGITEVDRPVHLNRLFREKGWLSIKEEVGMETLQLGSSKVFAIADHQVAHIYINDESLTEEVEEFLQQVEGVELVLNHANKNYAGIDHERAGDLVVVSDSQSWFTYYYWDDDKKAPDFARCVDIHKKCGYDPVELFLDPDIKLPKLQIAKRLLKKSLGFRMLMDVIPLDANLVKGSHGRLPESEDDWPVLIGDFPQLPKSKSVQAQAVYEYLFEHCKRGSGYQSPDL